MVLEDVLVGEVWVGSGQSNMDMPVELLYQGRRRSGAGGGQVLPANATDSRGNPGWQPATPENNQKFSALLFSFGVPLQKELDMPLGLLVGAVGGTPSGFWLSQRAYQGDVACRQAVEKFAANYSFEKAEAQYKQGPGQVGKGRRRGQTGRHATAAQARPGLASRRVPGAGRALVRIADPPLHALRHAWRPVGSGRERDGHLRPRSIHADGRLDPRLAQEWGQGEFPFLYVQKPSGGGPAWNPADPVTQFADKFTRCPRPCPTTGSTSKPTSASRTTPTPPW